MTYGVSKVLGFCRVVAACAVLTPLYAQYGGPAVLLRGQAPAAMTPTQIDFRPFLTLTGVYDNGLNGVAVDTQGKTVNVTSFGVEVSGGISGFHSWKHTTIGLDLRGSLRHYTGHSFYDGSDELLLLGVTHMFTRHIMFSLRENAGLYSQNYAVPVLQQTVPFDPSTTYVPTSDFFDNRTMYFSTQADLTVQKSTRLSYDIGADGFMTRRRSSALYGVSGAGARGDVQYRLSRRSTIGAGYNFTHYSFTGIFSSTDLHSVVGSYGIRLTRSLELASAAGVAFYETKFVRAVPIDPAIAAVIGIKDALQVFYKLNHIPTFTVRLSDTVHRGIFYVSAARTVTPGNGLFLTSTATAASAGYAYTGLKRWSIGGSANYATAESIGNVLGAYSVFTSNATISRQILRVTHAVLTFNARKYGSSDFQNYNRWTYGVRLGLGFTPGDIPIRLW